MKMAHHLNEEEIAIFKQTFSLFDKDKDGKILSSDELRSLLRSIDINPTEQELHDAITKIDKTGTGSIDFSDFLELMVKNDLQSDADKAITAFRVFDLDGNGFITKNELIEAMSSLGVEMSEDEASELVNEVDRDGDGLISYVEFVAMIFYLK